MTFTPKSQGNIKVFGTVYLPNAAKWNIALAQQNLCGVATNANFTINRFTVEIYDNSFLIYSSDSDVKSWFQDGAIYVFTFYITHK